MNLSQNKKLETLRIIAQQLLKFIDMSENQNLATFHCEDCPMIEGYQINCEVVELHIN